MPSKLVLCLVCNKIVIAKILNNVFFLHHFIRKYMQTTRQNLFKTTKNEFCHSYQSAPIKAYHT